MEEITIFLTSPIFWFCTGVLAIIFNIAFFLIVGRTETEKYIRLATLLATFGLVIVGVWYSYETRGLKITAEKQIKELQNQFRISNVPGLFLSVIHKDKVIKLIEEGKITQKSGKVTYSKEKLTEVLKYYVLLENVSQQIAYEVRLYLFRADIKSFMRSPSFKVYVKPDKPEAMYLIDETGNYIDETKLIEEVNENYGLELYSLKDYLKNRNINCLLLFYKDIQGYTYLRTRHFLYNKQNNLMQGEINFYEFKL
ncbi:MAG TPA: hypothetical protein VKA34_13530 [Balneolales bacterium]|nr:hypothetical protein [Balneolales bacterium]